jgi:hypothetical protein
MLLFAFNTQAQNEEIIVSEETISVPKSDHSPKKATLYSTFLPGLGQAYNKKYWKIPILYAGLGTTVYFIFWNSDQYNDVSTAFDIRQAGGDDKYKGVYSDEQLIILQNTYRNQRDLSILLTVLVYGLNVLDANIDAHLFDFDVSDDLNLRIEPALVQNAGFNVGGYNYAMKMTLKF